jgi:PTS system nitrogen regulatory IIA component
VNEKAVIQWIRKNHLPAEMVNAEYLINRADLLEWATGRGLNVDPSIFNMPDEKQAELPAISQALAEGGIFFGIRGGDKESILRNVVKNLSLPPGLDPEFILQVLLTREAMGTTAIGDGIAIPHVRNPILLQSPMSKITLCFLEKPVEFNAPDGKPVTILFTLTSPTVRTHLHLLSGLSFALKDRRLKDALKIQPQKERILSTLRQIESETGGRRNG